VGFRKEEPCCSASEKIDGSDHSNQEKGKCARDQGPGQYRQAKSFLNGVRSGVIRNNLSAVMGSTVFQECEFLTHFEGQGLNPGPGGAFLHSPGNRGGDCEGNGFVITGLAGAVPGYYYRALKGVRNVQDDGPKSVVVPGLA